jgi:type VI secretion system secreted protein VgrG
MQYSIRYDCGLERFSLRSVRESYQSGAPYGMANREQAQRSAELQQQALEARQQRWFASGTVRTLRAGTRFTLSQGPLPELHDPNHPGFNVLSVKHLGINNLPKPAKDGLAELLGGVPELLQGLLHDLQANFPAKSASSPIGMGGSSYEFNSNSNSNSNSNDNGHINLDPGALLAQAQALGYANQAELIRADVPWRPLLADAAGARPHPTAMGTQTALVVGPDGTASDLSAGELLADKCRRMPPATTRRETMSLTTSADTPPGFPCTHRGRACRRRRQCRSCAARRESPASPRSALG